MLPAEHIEVLRREGELLACAAERSTWDTQIPTCPEWNMRDLVRHMGGIHRWAAMHVRESRQRPVNGFEEAVPDGWPPDEQLLEWFRDGHARLVETLSAASPDVQCFTFLPAPSPLAFWARRQAHETAIHRADSEAPGGSVTPYPTEFARDGLDELLLAFFVRSAGRLTSAEPRSLHVHATDTEGEWLVRFKADAAEVTAEHGTADCTVAGKASDLYLLMWNRRRAEGLDVQGDARVLDLWRSQATIRWG